MGFGHRVYKNYDPRAAIIKKTADEVLSALGKRDDLLDIAMELEGYALADDYFVSRKLYPNVDFYTGLLYRAMGFPTKMFTVLFAIGRLPGWIAQWHEMINDPATKIGRPRQLYTGPASRHLPRRADRPGGHAGCRWRPVDSSHEPTSPRRHRPQQGPAGRAGHDHRARPGSGRGGGRDPGLRGLPHRPALPQRRHQRRVPVPARARGSRRGRERRRRGHRGGARRLRDPELAGGLRAVPGLPAGAAAVLLQHPQRHPEDDARRTAPSCRRRWASARSPTRRWWRPASAPRSTRRPRPGGRPARLRGDGRPRRGDQHRRGGPRRLGRRHRLRRRRHGRGRRRPAGRREPPSSPSTSTSGSWRWPGSSAPPHVVNSDHHRSGGGDPRGHRRLRRGRGGRRGRHRRDLQAGLPGPRPGRHRGAGRRARRRTPGSSCRCSTSSAGAAR